MFAALAVSIAWLPVLAGAFALGAAIWLLVEVRRATRQPGVVPIEAIFLDDDDENSDDAVEALLVDEPEPAAAEPPMHALVPLYVFASTLPGQPVPVPTAADLAPTRSPAAVTKPESAARAVPEPLIDLSSVTSQLAALTEAVARIADRLDPLVVPVRSAPPERLPVYHPPARSIDDDDLLSWPSDDEVNRFNGYDRSP